MAYKITNWEWSNVTQDEEVRFTDGPKTIAITSAVYNDENAEGAFKYSYRIGVECIEVGESCGAKTMLTYWLRDSRTGQDNRNSIGTLISLGKAIFGDDFTGGIPAPADIIGAVCVADIRMKTSDTGKNYPRVYRFMPASEDFSVYSNIEQYFRTVVPAPRD